MNRISGWFADLRSLPGKIDVYFESVGSSAEVARNGVRQIGDWPPKVMGGGRSPL